MAEPYPLKRESPKFRFHGKRMLLTYKHHIDKTILIDFIASACGTKEGNPAEFKFIRCAHELGSSDVKYEHTHVLVHLAKIWDCENARRLDVEWNGEIIHPNWKAIVTNEHWDNNLRYISKEDPENSDLITLEDDKSLTERVWECETLGIALKRFVKKPSDTSGIISLYSVRPQVINDLVEPTYNWQVKILGMMQDKPDLYAVHWVFDPKGRSGKSTLVRYALANQIAGSSSACGGARNFATVIQSAIEEGWNQRCWIFDFPRTVEDFAIYESIEALKNGQMTATKYKGRSFSFKIPHVFAFANFLPKITELSLERWRIFQIVDLELVRLDTYKLLKHASGPFCSRPGIAPGDYTQFVMDDAPLACDSQNVAQDNDLETNPGGGLTLKASPEAEFDLESHINDLLDMI